MNEEKKLTDEEIVKAYFVDCKKRSCETCPLGDIETCHEYIIDLIHRLQAENEQLKCDTYKTSWKGKFLEAKKEIERMAEKNNEIFQRYLNVIDKNNDLQNQVDKVEAEKEDLCRSNERLQKQVDELKAELEKAYKIERANIQAEIAEAGTSCHWCKNATVKDTAKEILTNAIEGFVFNFTADTEDYRNGYDKAIDDYDNKIKEFIKERYGVEVE